MTSRQIETVLWTAARNPTPFYVYDREFIRETCRAFRTLPWRGTDVHFATMANAHPRFLSLVTSEGLHLFVNSLGHLEAAQRERQGATDIVFAASAMSESIMRAVHAAGARVILDSISQVNTWRECLPGEPFGIRCNLGSMVRARQTRAGYFTGPESRLGLAPDDIRHLADQQDIEGLHLYAGTDICDLTYFESCYRALASFAPLFPGLKYLDFGGGFGLEDDDGLCFDVEGYGLMSARVMEDAERDTGNTLRMIIEPGRIIGGRAGLFVCRAVDIKTVAGRQGIGVDASSAQFPRPLLYPDSARHPVWLVRDGGLVEKPDEWRDSCVFGCSTYSRDFLSHDCRLPEALPGDLVVFGNAGSYCASLHTRFLGFPPASEIFL